MPVVEAERAGGRAGTGTWSPPWRSRGPPPTAGSLHVGRPQALEGPAHLRHCGCQGRSPQHALLVGTDSKTERLARPEQSRRPEAAAWPSLGQYPGPSPRLRAFHPKHTQAQTSPSGSLQGVQGPPDKGLQPRRVMVMRSRPWKASRGRAGSSRETRRSRGNCGAAWG